MQDDPLVIQIQPILRQYDSELFQLDNIPSHGQLIPGERLDFNTVINIIEETMPDGIKIRCHRLWSGTVANFIHEIYSRFYILKETQRYYLENDDRSDDLIELIFIKPPFAERKMEELKKSREF